MQRFSDFIKKYYYILIPIIFFITLRIPSLFESYWYGDEGIYAALAEGMHQGKHLYSEIWDHKPPLLYWFYYLAGFLEWNQALVVLKLFSIGFGIVSLVFISKILNEFFDKRRLHFVCLTFFSIVLGSVAIEGNVANAEVFYITFNVLILYFLLKNKLHFLVGFLAFLSFAIKTPSFIESAFILLIFALIYYRNDGLKSLSTRALKVSAGFLIPLFLLVVMFKLQGNLTDFLQAAFKQNLSYSAERDPYVIVLGVEVSPTIFKSLVVLLTFVFSTIAFYKDQISKRTYVILNIFVIEVFAALLSGRNYPHYLIQATAGFTLLLGLYLDKLKRKNLYNNFKYLFGFLVMLQLTIVTFTKGDALQGTADPREYYPDFVKVYITQSSPDYEFGWANSNSVKITKDFSAYFNEKYGESDESFYVYSNEPWILALIERPSTNKFVVYYHLTFNEDYLNESIEKLNQSDLLVWDRRTADYDKFTMYFDQFEMIDKKGDFEILRRK